MTKVIDLSLPIDTATMSPPSQAKKVEISYSYRTPGWWQASLITLSSHTATHVDSPLHVVKGAPKIGEIGLEKLIGDAIILDLTHKEPNTAITSKDLEKFDKKYVLTTSLSCERTGPTKSGGQMSIRMSHLICRKTEQNGW